MKKTYKTIAGGFLAVTMLAACSSDPEETSSDSSATEGSESSSEGGDAVLAMGSDAVDLDPHGSNDTSSSHIRTNIYERLVMHDENTELQPHLAEEFEQIDDLTWEFKLVEGVTFHNGEEFTADDVKATLERAVAPETANPRVFLYEMIEDVEVVDDYTVHITTEYPFAPLPAHLAHDGGGMMSAVAIEEEENGERNLDIDPIGTGPFELDNWDQGNEVVLSNYADYWGGSVPLDSATYSVVSEQLTRIGMLETNEAHIADDVDPTNAGTLETMDGVSLSTVESLRLDYLGMNNEVEPFDNVDVRRAITKAIDKSTIIEGIFQGYGTEAVGPVNPLVNGYSDGIEPLEYDLEEAQSIMDEAGYEDGFSVSLWYEEGDQVSNQLAVVIQDQLSEINIDVDLQTVEWGSLLDATANGEHDMVLLGWTTVTADADYALYSVFHSDMHGGSGNRTFYTNEDVNELLEEGRRSTDEDERMDIYKEAQQIIIDEATMVPTVHDDFRVGVSDTIEGFIHYPNGVFDLREARIVGDGVESGY
ncbi:oligopeptide ABC transporter, periplasmic oligopeptide-binding protein OppA [Geomicrobium sp. JCM 19037]|uniref:glutathione ABC transporter substrate-binding protein n=1 Tax=Geomicrobium sp. JCM 19037 TaxID=1460634 RepID=UPI00045F4D04|nr:glutathione ABC transporter substrate-binding protein [Geomicrobium sp. JCM 19037]GAK02140.1 oligopeptide ABC transporter, periplasmic oligopeptide-binding protein OppA [Geomicrobium sp. JCM 19037]